jgi:flagellar basal-body rod modification protein FlgD
MIAVTPLAASTAGAGATGEAANPNAEIGQNGFLKLMIAQLQAQNPMQPANNTEYISELATFTELEQMTNLANAGELSGGVQLIGRSVTYTDASGAHQTGTVESVQTTRNGTTLTINHTAGIAETSVTEIT